MRRGAGATRSGPKPPRSPAVLRPRGHARGQLYDGGNPLHFLAQDLGFKRLLAQEPLQLKDLRLGSTQFGCLHDPFAGTGGRERAALYQPTPREQLVGVQPVAAGDERDGLAGQIDLLDESHLLRRGPAPPPSGRSAARLW